MGVETQRGGLEANVQKPLHKQKKAEAFFMSWEGREYLEDAYYSLRNYTIRLSRFCYYSLS